MILDKIKERAECVERCIDLYRMIPVRIGADCDELFGKDIPALIAEIERLRAGLGIFAAASNRFDRSEFSDDCFLPDMRVFTVGDLRKARELLEGK